MVSAIVHLAPPFDPIRNPSYIRNHNIDCSNIICMEDFKAPGFLWPSLTSSGREPGIGRELIKLSLSLYLVQLVRDVTRQDAFLNLISVSFNTSEAGFYLILPKVYRIKRRSSWRCLSLSFKLLLVHNFYIHHSVSLKTKKTNRKLPWMSRDFLLLSRFVQRQRRTKNPDKPDSVNKFHKAKNNMPQ